MAKEIHVVMVPWLAFGHLTPFRHLSVALARKGVKVSFISTPKNIQRLAKIPTELTHLINMVELSLPVEKSGVLNGAEASVDLASYEQNEDLLIAYDLLKQPFKQFVVDQSPDWIVVDVLSSWAAEVAHEFGIPVILFSTFPAAFLSFLGPPELFTEEGRKKKRLFPESMMKPPEWFDFPSVVAYRKHEANDFHSEFYQEVHRSEVPYPERFSRVYDACKAIAIRSCPELESQYLTVVGKVTGRPVFPVGLLFPERAETLIKGSWENMFKWLDEQEKSSVVFVGFGSESKVAKQKVYEIAYGLEISKLPFFWILPSPSLAGDEDNSLPAGFCSRTDGRGVVKFGWAPQSEILAHPSIGCSLFHTGWGSTVENLQHGNVLVLLPLINDQGLNARMLVEKGLAIEVERDEDDGSFTRDDIAKCLNLAMVSEQGQELRKRAITFLEDVQLHEENHLARFVEYLKMNKGDHILEEESE